MLSRQVIVMSIVIGVTITATVEGLQCYVCEDCNEYQDFKELSICGEISVDMTQTTQPGAAAGVSSTTLKPSVPELPVANTTSTTAKSPAAVDNEDYLYEYSMEAHDDGGASADRRTSTTAPTTMKNQSQTVKATTAVAATTDSPKSTTTKNTTKAQSQTSKETTTAKNTTMTQSQTTTTTASTTTTKVVPTSTPIAKPAEQPDDYDYMEYEDPKSFDVSRQSRASDGSLLKIDEPVCYMYRYYANNTVFTNRGCTTLLNANKFLTCQALSNGATMVGCRVCTTDGCNKFDLDESGEDHLFSAGVLAQGSAAMIAILGIMISWVA